MGIYTSARWGGKPCHARLRRGWFCLLEPRGHEPVAHWEGILRQMVVLNFVAKEVEKYGVLHLTEKEGF